MCEQFDASAIGAYVPDDPKHRAEVCVEINNGDPLCVIYMDPEEAILFAQDVIREASLAEARKIAA